MFFAEGEIGWHLIAHHAREERNGVPARNVFTKRHQMDFAVSLDETAAFRDQ